MCIRDRFGHWLALAGKCYDSRHSFVSEKDGKIDAICLAFLSDNIWNPEDKELQVLVFHRFPTGTKLSAGRVIKEFVKAAEQSIEAGFIKRAIVSELLRTNVDYEKLGFSKLDKRYYIGG